jgi:hypothetical protein
LRLATWFGPLHNAKIKGGSITVSDTEGYGEFAHKVITKDVLLEGLQVMAADYTRHFADFMEQNENAETGDVFFQCCCFGKSRLRLTIPQYGLSRGDGVGGLYPKDQDSSKMASSKHEAGGKTRIPVPIWVRSSVVFGGQNDEYRYRLVRVWDPPLPILLFVMMNPSTADPLYDDPTVAKCRRYAEDWGYGTLLVGNTFAYRATDQSRLMKVSDPIGPENDTHLVEMANSASMVVFAYGKPHRSLQSRGPAVARLLSREGTCPLHVLQLCADGTPSHPLYLRGDLKPSLWK